MEQLLLVHSRPHAALLHTPGSSSNCLSDADADGEDFRSDWKCFACPEHSVHWKGGNQWVGLSICQLGKEQFACTRLVAGSFVPGPFSETVCQSFIVAWSDDIKIFKTKAVT